MTSYIPPHLRSKPSQMSSNRNLDVLRSGNSKSSFRNNRRKNDRNKVSEDIILNSNFISSLDKNTLYTYNQKYNITINTFDNKLSLFGESIDINYFKKFITIKENEHLEKLQKKYNKNDISFLSNFTHNKDISHKREKKIQNYKYNENDFVSLSNKKVNIKDTDWNEDKSKEITNEYIKQSLLEKAKKREDDDNKYLNMGLKSIHNRSIMNDISKIKFMDERPERIFLNEDEYEESFLTDEEQKAIIDAKYSEIYSDYYDDDYNEYIEEHVFSKNDRNELTNI